MNDTTINDPANSIALPTALTPETYIRDRVNDQIEWLNNKSVLNQKKYKRFRKIEIIAAALIPFITALAASNISVGTLSAYVNLSQLGTLLVGALGITITIISGILGLEQYQKNWIEYRVLCESLIREKNLYLADSELYKDNAEAFKLFVSRVEALMAKENSNWSQNMLAPPDKKSGQ